MLLQPLIYWLFNHWAQCKRKNQRFLLTLMMVCCTFIAKPEHLVAALLSSLEILQLVLSLLSSSTPASPSRSNSATNSLLTRLRRFWSMNFNFRPPPPHKLHTAPTNLAEWQTDSFHHRSGDGHFVCLWWFHKGRCVAAFQSETLSRL